MLKLVAGVLTVDGLRGRNADVVGVGIWNHRVLSIGSTVHLMSTSTFNRSSSYNVLLCIMKYSLLNLAMGATPAGGTEIVVRTANKAPTPQSYNSTFSNC